MQEELLKADVFFFVATLAVAAVAIVLVIAGIYAIKILRDARWLMSNLKFKYRFMSNLIKAIFKK